MTKVFSWHCPFCNQLATITDENTTTNYFNFYDRNKDGTLTLITRTVTCPNTECREYTIEIKLTTNGEKISKTLGQWKLRPVSAAKQFPNYIPEPIIKDYNEACLIVTLSPKASATLSRRCLQGIIRDFWNVKKDKLVDAINAIHDKVDPVTWSAIDSVRSIGNIGAHMEKDINLILDVEPDEAALLIGLIETLLEEWYVHQHERERRMQKVIDAAASKKAKKLEGKHPA